MGRWIKTMLLAAVAGTVMGVALGFARSAMLPDPYEEVDVGAIEPLEIERPITEKESGMPAYEGGKLTSFGNQLSVQGTPMSTGWFVADDPIEEVQLYYERRLAEAGVPMVTKRFPNGFGYVGYKERTTDLMHTVTLMPQGKDSTMVFVSTSSAVDMMTNMTNGRPPADLPHPANATQTMVMGGDVGPVKQKWVNTTLPGQSLQQTIEFYRTGFVERGWSVSESKTDPAEENGWLLARKGSREARVTLKHDRLRKGDFGTQVFMLLSDRNKKAGPQKAPTN